MPSAFASSPLPNTPIPRHNRSEAESINPVLRFSLPEPKVPDLYEFLAEAELQQYYNSLKNELKITNVTHLKYATDEDLQVSGLSRPEIRRLRKYYEKYYPHGYLNKIRRLLQTPRKDEPNSAHSPTSASCGGGGGEPIKACPSPGKIPNNKHIIPPDAICVNKQLGTGEFGIVQQGVWTNGSERIQVAIKCLCRERMQSNPMEFLKEAAIMHSIEHENIVRLYGVVLDTESLMLVTELAHLRSLLECLKDPGLRVSFLTVPTLCEFASQICNGMMYLENKRFIHRDLAARNILVFSKNKVKISDFGLSRALGVGKDYYQTNFNVNLKLPIAWCAPECINFLRFTHASDVWAYGVCLWEIFSYGFQPWAALTGHQILEAIDEPHYQRLEKPECCPKEYYGLMLKCWQHDATKRPRFIEIFQLLPDMKPEQLKTIVSHGESKKDYLMYRQGEIITVLEKGSHSPYWKGVLNSGKTGLFNPAFTVAYLDSLPSSVNRDTFGRTVERSSKRKIRTDMISGPQNDLKHTGHVGIDGVSFGDVAFLASPQNLPRQIVTPYKPSEDLEQTPLLLPPTPTSPDSIHTASGYFSESLQLTGHQSFINAGENHHSTLLDHHHTAGTGHHSAAASAFDFRNSGFKDSNPFINADSTEHGDVAGSYNLAMGGGGGPKTKDGLASGQHEYHEISDDELTTEKVFDPSGPSLMDEMEHVFKSMSTISEQDGAGPLGSPDAENTNMRNELTELSSKLCRKNSSSTTTSSGTLGKSGSKSKSKKTGTVKPISVKDEKLLKQVIEMTNEISAKSMTDLVTDSNQQTSSPKRKFSFRFPHIHTVVGGAGDAARGGPSNGIIGAHSAHHSSGLTGVHASGGSGGGGGGSGGSSSVARGLAHTDKDHPTAASASSSSAIGPPHGYGGGSHTATLGNAYREKRNFSQEVNNVPDLQSTITEEARIAYNSLVENPGSGTASVHPAIAASVGSSTLPRAKLTNTLAATASFRFKDIDCCSPPTEPAPKSPEIDLLDMNGGGADDCDRASSNPLRLLKSKHFPLTARPKSIGGRHVTHQPDGVGGGDQSGQAESPSYLTSPEYTYNNALISPVGSEPTLMKPSKMTMFLSDGETSAMDGGGANNPIPLPPRDRNKTIPVNQKRHVRKYPLIIPATGLQRTLNKVTQITPVDEQPDSGVFLHPTIAGGASGHPSAVADASKDDHNDDQATVSNLDVGLQKSLEPTKLTELHKDILPAFPSELTTAAGEASQKRAYTREFLENNFPNMADFKSLSPPTTLPATIPAASAILTRRRTASDASGGATRKQPPPPVSAALLVPTARDPTYENLDIFQTHSKLCIDTASLHCESILENDTESFHTTHPALGTDTVDGFDAASSLLFDSIPAAAAAGDRKRPTNLLLPTVGGPGLELLEKQLQSPPDGELIKSINFVSCEDLLEFAEKPKGRARGLESDEVRIMSKVLGKKPSPEQCLLTLEFIDWDIHKAIKLCKLQAILESYNLSLQECRDALQTYDWDLHTTALKLKGGGGR
ncbi:activated Cdc42 kinase-like [Anopheles cruzii]|uniref:activated Cdc42 kinase-like n=1 Tax=Anopheles cruzii TaxID=68878 RepID=UPI0022EC63FE|nr:activated Cdc42 kinase-like [Anopheles cruzii]